MDKKTERKEFGNRILRQWNRENYLLLLRYFLLAIGVNLIVELCNRRGFVTLWDYLTDKPLQFVYGVCIVFMTFLFCLLFRKRNYFVMLVAGVWIALAVTSFVMLSGFVATPLTAQDIAVLRSVKEIIEIYLSDYAVIAILIVLSLLLGGLLFLAFHFRNHTAPYAFALVHIALFSLLIWGASSALIKGGYLDSQFVNIPDAYQNNGFVYCFTCSALYQGIDRPEDYSPERIEEMMRQVHTVDTGKTRTPNFVFVQLESFFDVKYLRDVVYSNDPLPNFTRLKEKYSSGLLRVPSIGAGTVNTEFEVLSQMNLQDFGVGEYPYKTVVRDQVCDSIAYDLKELGYETHAIHNNNATFYQRNKVYANLGFDAFTSLEYMWQTETNPLGWAKDKCLTQEILDVLQSTPGKDFVFTVSVQPHGQYPTEVIDENQALEVVSGMDAERRVGFEYYINQIYETDQFVGELVEALENYDEDVVLVFYGDHLPSFQITNEELSDGNVQTTEYIIWANFPMQRQQKNIHAFQLSSLVMERMGITSGVLTKYHQLHRDDPADDAAYLDGLRMLDYDILYGDCICYGGEIPFAPTALRMGTREITAKSAAYNASMQMLFVRGDNFTPFSTVFVDGKRYETEYVSPQLLRVADVALEDGSEINVAQMSKSDELRVLTQTPSLIYRMNGG